MLHLAIIVQHLKHFVAMALVKGGNKLMGSQLYVSDPSKSETIPVEIVNPVFH